MATQMVHYRFYRADGSFQKIGIWADDLAEAEGMAQWEVHRQKFVGYSSVFNNGDIMDTSTGEIIASCGSVQAAWDWLEKDWMVSIIKQDLEKMDVEKISEIFEHLVKIR